MVRINCLDSMFTDSDVLEVKRSSREDSPPRNNTLENLTSTQLPRAQAREVITISLVASPEH